MRSECFKKKSFFFAVFFAFCVYVSACATTTIPFEFTDTFNVTSEHLKEIRRSPWEVENNTGYRVILDHNNKIIDLRGRETKNKDDIKNNFKFRTRKPPKEFFPGINGKIKIHSGFLIRYESVRDTLLNLARDYPDYAIRASGFSLGGAWTQLFLLDAILLWPDRDIKAIFYAPPNPWRKLPKEYQKELARRTVFVSSRWDPFTWMRAICFYRYGHNITIGKWWRILPPQHEPAQMVRALDEYNQK